MNDLQKAIKEMCAMDESDREQKRRVKLADAEGRALYLLLLHAENDAERERLIEGAQERMKDNALMRFAKAFGGEGHLT
jgi:chitinase